jgi:hypothetical protein
MKIGTPFFLFFPKKRKIKGNFAENLPTESDNSTIRGGLTGFNFRETIFLKVMTFSASLWYLYYYED